jgi:hypothetical protein
MMHRTASGKLAVTLGLCAALAACSTPEPAAYSGLASSLYLAPNARDDTGHIPYSYATGVNWRSYDKLIIDPVTIYRGPDQQFGDLSEIDKAKLAAYMDDAFAEKLRHRFTLVSAAMPSTLRLKLTLTGAATNTAVLAPLTRFDLSGGLYNGVQSVRGGEGLMTGSVLYAVEIYDAATARLLGAYVTKQYPNAYNIGATMGSLAAAKTGIDKGAEALAEQFK